MYNGKKRSIYRPNLNPVETFLLRSIIDALPTKWKKILKTEISPLVKTFDNQVKLKVNDTIFPLSKLSSKQTNIRFFYF